MSDFNYYCLQSNFFNEYAMDGVSEEANEIYLDLIPDNLMKALRTAQSAKSVKIKLTKKHTPCLTFEVEQVCYNVSTGILKAYCLLRHI